MHFTLESVGDKASDFMSLPNHVGNRKINLYIQHTICILTQQTHTHVVSDIKV